MRVEDTSVFQDSGFHRPELSKPPEKKKLSKILKAIDSLGKLVMNGHSADITKEHFPQFSESELNEAIKLAQANRLHRLIASGNIKEITPENFPDLPEELIEKGLFEARSNNARWYWQESQSTADKDLKAAMVTKANDILSKRDEHIKAYLKRNEEPREIPIILLVKEGAQDHQRPRASPYL